MSYELTWLGTAGFHICSSTHSLLIDPYFSRLPLANLAWGPVKPDLQAINTYTRKADAILITHSHIDHLSDAPVIAQQQQIPVYGTHSTARLLQANGVDENLIHTVRDGEEFFVGDIQVKVFPATHMPIPGFPSRTNLPALHTPLKAIDYQMDRPLAYRVTVGQTTFLTDPGDPPVGIDTIDVLALSPYHPFKQIKRLLSSLNPRAIIPSHWDMFWLPLNKPLRAMIPWQYQPGDASSPFLKRIHAILPACRIIQPKIFEPTQNG